MSRGMAALAAAVLLLAACGPGGASHGPTHAAATTATAAPAVELNILAAASLRGVLDQAKPAYEAKSPGVTLVTATDSSAALETKIEQGAPADVFLSADTTNPTKLVDGGFAAGSPTAFAGNELAIIVPTGNPAAIASARDLARAGVKVIAAGDDVPITRYATQLVQNLAREKGYPAGFAAMYAANVVSKEENVKAVVAKIELGEGDAAIVYATDARASRKVATVGIPPTANVAATYAGVVVKVSPKIGAARAFLDWFAGPGGQAILAGFGFLPPPA